MKSRAARRIVALAAILLSLIIAACTNIFVTLDNPLDPKAQHYIGGIRTVAGNGNAGFSGDGGAAVDASLNQPTSIAVDGAGNLFVFDANNWRIRQVDAGGTITTVAGNGTGSSGGDGGLATAAGFGFGSGLAVSPTGTIYVADTWYHCVRAFTVGGSVNTVAGTPYSSGFSGDGGPAIAARLNAPMGLALDGAGNLYILDTFNNRIRKLETATGTITTLAGNGNAGFSGDGGPATSAEINLSYMVFNGIASDQAGNVFFVDSVNYRVRKVDTSGIISTVAGDGTSGYSGDGGSATSAQLGYPQGLAVDRVGNLYIADSGSSRIREVDTKGNISTVVGNGQSGYSGEGGNPTSASLASPIGVAVDSAGVVYFTEGGMQVGTDSNGVPYFGNVRARKAIFQILP